MSGAEPRPLVVSLALDATCTAFFAGLRRALFPPGRTQVGAHLTLFHALPGALRDEVEATLADVAATVPRLDLTVGEPVSLGRGVAYPVTSEVLDRLHEGLRRAWLSHLTRQDAQRLRSHVTVQNKVEPAVARATLARLRSEPRPGAAVGTGFELHRYDGGPWTTLATYRFGTTDSGADRGEDSGKDSGARS